MPRRSLSKGQPIRKLYQWLTNSADIAEALSKKMSPDELTQCVPLIGKEVRRSARYPQPVSYTHLTLPTKLEV